MSGRERANDKRGVVTLTRPDEIGPLSGIYCDAAIGGIEGKMHNFAQEKGDFVKGKKGTHFAFKG